MIFDNQCIVNNAFHKNKRPISIDEVDMNGIVLYEKDSCGKKGSFKCFTYYINETDPFSVPLCIKLCQVNGYIK